MSDSVNGSDGDKVSSSATRLCWIFVVDFLPTSELACSRQPVIVGGSVPLPQPREAASGTLKETVAATSSSSNAAQLHTNSHQQQVKRVPPPAATIGFSSGTTPPLSLEEVLQTVTASRKPSRNRQPGAIVSARNKAVAVRSNSQRSSGSSGAGATSSGGTSPFSNWIALVSSSTVNKETTRERPPSPLASTRSIGASGQVLDISSASSSPTKRVTIASSTASSPTPASRSLSPSSSLHPSTAATSLDLMSTYNSGASVRSGRHAAASPPNSANSQYPSPYHASYTSSNSGAASRSPNPGGKVSQMLGVNTFDMPMSATQSFGSMHSSDQADTIINRFNNIGQSGHREKSKDPSSSNSSAKMTLKKARSLFSSSSSKSKSPDFLNPPDLPSPPRANGLNQSRGASSNPYASGGSAALAHSKSYGSLVNRSPDYRFPGSSSNGDMNIRSQDYYYNKSSGKDQPISPVTASSQPYSASVALRKASLPNIEHPSRRYGSNGTAAAADPLLGGGPGQDADCPVCLESLSIRLAGESPHIVPVCGHKLHADCFEAAYGDPADFGGADAMENLMGSGRARKKTRPQGTCAVCRSEMLLGDPADSGKNSQSSFSQSS